MWAIWTVQLTVSLLVLVFNFDVVYCDNDFQLESVPWEFLPYGRLYRNGVWFPWGEFYFIPDTWGPPRARAVDPPDSPDPVSKVNKQPKAQRKVKKMGRKKKTLKKKKRPRAYVEEQENESEGPRKPRRNRNQRNRLRQNRRP